MSERVNRKDLIIETAASLFVKNGYSATSVRQIADAVGVTEAALYYHFRDGKRELLQAVVENHTPDLIKALEGCEQADSLHSFISTFGDNLRSNLDPNQLDRFRWVLAEFPRFSDDERAIFQDRMMEVEQRVVNIMARFVASREAASQVFWTILCTMMGYGQLFINLGLQDRANFEPENLIEITAASLDAAYGISEDL